MQHTDVELHAQGKTKFTSDQSLLNHALSVYPVVASIAHGKIKRIDISKALACSGVIAIFSAADIPGINQIGNVSSDEVLLASDEVVYIGQPIALVVAESPQVARKAADLVLVDYEPLPAVFDVRVALRLGLYIAPKRVFVSGDVAASWPECALIVEGSASTGAQEHMYFETQTAIAYPFENNVLRVYSATQSPGLVQKIIARVLNLPMHAVEGDVQRLGGGFGGKEEQATAFAVMVALAAHRLQRIVKIQLQRDEDCRLTGKRHPYEANYKLGLDSSGKILAYQVELLQNAGALADLSLAIMERSMLHAAGSYFIPNIQVSAVSCRTNLPPNTAFRGFGAPQAVYILECALYQAALKLAVEVSWLQQRNLLHEGQSYYYGMLAQHCIAGQCWQELDERYNLAGLRHKIVAFNARHRFEKRAIALIPISFGIAFTATFLNQADALVHVYSDGSVGVSCGAVEMGQGVKQKIRQIAANSLGISEQRVKVESTNTTRIANMSPTAASTGADLNGQATHMACRVIKQRVLELAAQGLKSSVDELSIENEQLFYANKPTSLGWNELIIQAYMNRIALSEEVHYVTPDLVFDRSQNQGHPFAYHVYGSAAVEVTLDCLRGRYQIDRVYIVHDNGQPLNAEIDRGQVEGAVVQGLGWMTLEQVLFDADGRLLTDTFATYKIPDIHFAPEIDLYFLKAEPTSAGVLHSKAVGEPPFLYGIASYFALCEAIRAFNPAWQPDFNAPMTPEKVLFALYADSAATL